MRYSKGLASILLALIFQGCTSLFFYPDRITYHTPDFYDLAYDDIYFDSTDKTSLHAWRIYPKAERKGLIFVAHGNAQNLSSHFISWVWLVQEGYELFIFDYRGYGRSSGKIDLDGSIEDTKAALDYLENMHKSAYFVCGQSLGASLLINAMEARDNAKIKAVVLDSAFEGFADIANEKMDQGWVTWPFQWIPYLSLSDKYDIKNKIAELRKPLLFLHGSSDKIIFPNNSWTLFENAYAPKELWIVKNAQHIRSLENENVRKDFVQFLQEDKNHFHKSYSRMRVYE